MAVGAIAVVLAFGLLGAMLVFGGQKTESPEASPASSVASGIAVASTSPTDRPAIATPQTSVPSASTPTGTGGSTGAGASATATASQPPATNPPPNAAPLSAVDFDVQGQVIEIAFPLRADTAYRYRDNWYERRSGAPDPYNHAKPGASGELVRLHDGIDIYAPENEPVLAPFDGVVIDPASKWQPWEPDRYGLTVVVESDEPISPGYTAVLVHLDRVWVEMGQHVSRGQVIGVLGRTGNAENVDPQLHFELRAPFEIDWSSLGENRLVDAFNPYPSLQESDPNR